MIHFDEHTLELYVLNSLKAAHRHEEIEVHLLECHGCRTIVDEMRAFHEELSVEMEAQPVDEPSTERALVKSRTGIDPYFEPFGAPSSYRPRTIVGKFRYFVLRHPVAASVGGVTFAAACFALGMLVSNPFKKDVTIKDTNPALYNYNATSDMLEVLNADQQLLWQKKSPQIAAARDLENPGGKYVTSIIDLDGDGTNEVISGLHLLGYGTSANEKHLLAFDHEGKLLWNKRFTNTVHYLNRTYPPLFNVHAIASVELNGNGKKDIFVVANNESRSPSILYRLDHSGNILGTYWHLGSMLGMYEIDLTGDGRKEIVLCGRNDTNDTTRQEFGFVAVLDPARIIGEQRATTCSGYHVSPSEAEIYYLRFPRSDIDSVDYTGAGITRITEIDPTKFKFLMSNFDTWSIDFILDHQLHVLEVKSYDNTDAYRKSLVDKGRLTGTIDVAYLENLKNGVRYWDGQQWRKEVMKVQRPAL